tara:strand:+ start:1463 stop:1858 length:396 start_codon:yes stop_codon:yes gene_type:complete
MNECVIVENCFKNRYGVIMKKESFVDSVIRWNDERCLKDFNKGNEYYMLKEELTEFVDADIEHDMIDALCDIIVVAVGSINKLGYNVDVAMNETLKEIHSRTGTINNQTGKFEKDKNVKTYKANYSVAEND